MEAGGSTASVQGALLAAALLVGGCRTSTPESEAIATMRQALAAVQARDLDRAEEFARRAIEQRPGFIDPLMMLASIALERGDLAAARESYLEVLAIDPTDTAAGVQVGFTYVREGRFDEAREWFDKAIESDPGCEGAAYNLGSLCEQQRMYDEAVWWFEVSAVLDRSDPRSMVRIARVCLAQGRADAALAAAEEALRRYPQSQGGQVAKAEALRALGRSN